MIINPIGDFLACSGKARLTGIKQGKQGGDGLFLGHDIHLRSKKSGKGQQKKPARSELSADGSLILQLL
ncbi:hypothetical protein ACFS4T_18140 [Pseudomonas lini]